MASLPVFVLFLTFISGSAAKEHEHSRSRDCKHHHDGDHERCDYKRRPGPFVLEKPVEVFATEAGKVEALPGPKENGALARSRLGVSIMSMEPKALLLPQYLDASCVLYVRKGCLTLGWIEESKLLKQDMVTGDIYALPGGVVFYILNTDEGQRLSVYGVCDISESVEAGHFQSFFVAGGARPRSILSGFDPELVAAALKVSSEEVRDFLASQEEGAIVYTTSSQLNMLKTAPNSEERPKPYNLLRKQPAIKNDNGWSISVDGGEFSPLKKANIGVFAVSLKPGAMLAPHWNPLGGELALVTEGQGRIQVSYPNGTNALNERLREGDVVFVPRYFPMCQIASRDGNFEFVGFSSSAKRNRPQFLAGSTSVFRALDMETLSMAFGVSEEPLRNLTENQEDAVILRGFVEEDRVSAAL